MPHCLNLLSCNWLCLNILCCDWLCVPPPMLQPQIGLNLNIRMCNCCNLCLWVCLYMCKYGCVLCIHIWYVSVCNIFNAAWFVCVRHRSAQHHTQTQEQIYLDCMCVGLYVFIYIARCWFLIRVWFVGTMVLWCRVGLWV